MTTSSTALLVKRDALLAWLAAGLPLMASDFGLDLQLATGIALHTERYGAARGIWLPECAWDRGLDNALARRLATTSTAVYGFTGSGTGVLAQASLKTGTALQVVGKAKFSRSGAVTVGSRSIGIGSTSPFQKKSVASTRAAQ